MGSELIGPGAAVFQNTFAGVTVPYFGILGYRASSYDSQNPDSWTYTDAGGQNLFVGVTEFIVGVRAIVDDGTHYVWVKFSRPVVDNHTLFEIVGHDWNPVPGAPIPAGEPPGPPPVQATVGNDGGLNFSWDNRLGEMVLEASPRLDSGAAWQPVTSAGLSPASVSLGDSSRFFRLRRP